MVAGRVIYREGTFTNVDVAEAHTRLLETSDLATRCRTKDELPIVQLTREGRM